MTRKIRFDAVEYIDSNYVEDKDAIISITVPHMNSFYNEFDADMLALSDDIIDFIDGRVKNIPYKYHIILEFITPHMSKQEKENIVDIIKSHYGLLSSSRQRVLYSNNLKAGTLFILGTFFLFVSYSLPDSNVFVKEIFSIAGWVSAWETFNSLLLDAISIRNNKRNIDRLYNSKIKFKVRKKV
jgi:hypothetical protein